MKPQIGTSLVATLAFASVCSTAGAGDSPCHSFNVPGIHDTVFNGTNNVNVSVAGASINDCAGTVRALEITCSMQSLFAATYASEAAMEITLPGGQHVIARLSRLSDEYSTINNSRVRVALPAGTTLANMAGSWNFRFFDTFNDSGGAGESRVTNVHVDVLSTNVPTPQRTITVDDGVETARTNPQTDTGAFGQTFVKIDTPAVSGGLGQYLRIDAGASQGIPSDNRGQTPGYGGPWTVAVYNANGEVLATGTTSLSVNFGASGPDKKDGAAGTMSANVDTAGPLYVAFMPWDVGTEFLYDDDNNPSYPGYLPRAYPSFGMRGQANFASYYDYNVRVQRGYEATSPSWPDLSTVYTNRPLSSVIAPSSPGDVRLLRFRLPGPVNRAAGDYLDIDTSSSTVSGNYSGNFRNDTEIALFDASGHLIAADDDEGAGFASSLSFGQMVPARPAAANANPGQPFDGRDGANLPAGEYYLAVSMFDHAFADGFTVTPNGAASSVTGLIYVTINGRMTPVVQCGPADVGQAGGLEGADGLLDNNDFIVFINLFFANDPGADFGVAGGLPGSDGQFDNNDFIAFINRFFAGCP